MRIVQIDVIKNNNYRGYPFGIGVSFSLITLTVRHCSEYESWCDLIIMPYTISNGFLDDVARCMIRITNYGVI